MVKWNGIDLKDKGIIVENAPSITKAKKNYTSYTIPGRNGALIIDEGTYGTFNLSLKCHFNEDNYNINEIRAFLDGYGRLSIDNEKEYTAIINNSISFDKVLQFRKFTIQFLVNPIARALTSSTATITTSPSVLSISEATAEMNPVLTIEGTDDVSITINNKTFYLYGMSGEFILDSEYKVIVDSNGNNVSSKMYGDFPILYPGENSISYTGTITKFEIEYKKAYI